MSGLSIRPSVRPYYLPKVSAIFIAPLWKPCPSVILSFRHSIILSFCHNSDETWISLKPVRQSWSTFIWSIIMVEERLRNVLGLDQNSDFHGNRKRPLTCNGENDVSTFSLLFFIRSFSKLQVTRTGIKPRTSSNFGQIGLLPTELGALSVWKYSHRLIMWKWCLQARSFIFDRLFIKLADNQDRHKISDVFEFQPDWISHLGVTCPWGRFKFSIDLLWNLQVQLTFQMKIYWVPCGCNSSNSVHRLFWNFSDVFCMEWRCACALDIILWLFFSHFFCFVNLIFFQYKHAIKVYRQWVPCGCNSSYSFALIVLKHCRCFQHGMKMCMWFGYNTLFFSLFLLYEFSLSFYMKCYQSV